MKLLMSFFFFLAGLFLLSGCTLVPPAPELIKSRCQVFEAPMGTVDEVIPDSIRQEIDLSSKKVAGTTTAPATAPATSQSPTFMAFLSTKDSARLSADGKQLDTGMLYDKAHLFSSGMQQAPQDSPIWSYWSRRDTAVTVRAGSLTGRFLAMRIDGEDGFEIDYVMDHFYPIQKHAGAQLYYKGLLSDKWVVFVTPIRPVSATKGEQKRALVIMFETAHLR